MKRLDRLDGCCCFRFLTRRFQLPAMLAALIVPSVLAGCDQAVTANRQKSESRSSQKSPEAESGMAGKDSNTAQQGEGSRADDMEAASPSKVKPKSPGSQAGTQTEASQTKKSTTAGSGIASANTSSNTPSNKTIRIASREELDKPWIQSGELPRDYWEVWYVGNSPAGYLHQKVTAVDERRLQIKIESLVRVSRNGQKMEQKLVITSVETLAGELQRFEVDSLVGEDKTEVQGVVDFNSTKLKVDTIKNKTTTSKQIPWKKSYRGPIAVEQSLKRTPMQTGEQRKIEYFDPVTSEMVEAYIECGPNLRTPVLGGDSETLAEISLLTKVKDKDLGLRSTLWANQRGEVLKSYSSTLDFRTFRADEAKALAVRDAAAVDVVQLSNVSLSKPIDRASSAQSIKYRITYRDEDPFKAFSKKTNQWIRSNSPFEADITVVKADLSAPLATEIEKESNPDVIYLQSSPYIQSDDARVRALAKQFADSGSLEKPLVERLRMGVHRAIAKKNFSKGFQTAAVVAEQLEGDCTEHAVLLAAVARAAGLPARLAAGLVYTEAGGQPVMAYHLWTEVWSNNRWIPLDAVFSDETMGADHLKFFETPLDGNNPYIAFLPVLEKIGKLKIEVRDVQY